MPQHRPQWEAHQQAFLSVIFLIGATLMAALAMFDWGIDRLLFGACFFLPPVFAGISGCLMQRLWRQSSNDIAGKTGSAHMALGAGAGLLSALIFVAPQFVTNLDQLSKLDTSKFQPISVLTLFELMIGFIAGLTIDKVFRTLMARDALGTDFSPPKFKS